MGKFIKKVIYFMAIVLFFIVFFFSDEEMLEGELIGTSTDPNQTWTIYWYLCGSDLESEGGAASYDLEEMLSVSLPENVRVLIQTGGAKSWENEQIKSKKTQRFLYSSNGLELVDEKPKSNMGDAKTLEDFLRFGKERYPADKNMIIFWNHGGGSVTGAAFDELYDYDSLTLEEFDRAFRSVYQLSRDNPPFEVIGFDACLMATVDTAYTFSDIGKYLVASEELEPGGGWNYTGFLQKLADDTGMDGARLGQHICNTYMDDCGWLFEDDATLSVVDLNKAVPLFDAYEDMGAEALVYALKDPYFFIDLGRESENSINYGGNTREQGYSNMVDLGDLAKNCEEILPKNYERVIECLEDCVLYQVKGMYREESCGLSCYYSYNGDPEDFYNYLGQGCSDSFEYLFGYGFIGELPPEGMEYLSKLGYRDKNLPHVPNIEEDGEKEYPLELDDEGYAILKVEDKTMDLIKDVYVDFSYFDKEKDMIIMLGQDNDMEGDYETGEFKDNFRGFWGAIDNHIVYMEVVFEGKDYTAYSVPILLNGKEYNLRVMYDYNKEEYKILGARKGLEDNGMADRNLIQLKPGDKITTIQYGMSLSSESDDIVAIKGESFEITEKTKFEEKELGNGEYVMMFELVDFKNNSAYSEMVKFVIDGENMDVEILE